MTGRNPYAHGVRNNGHFVLAADVPTLAERFAAAGYDTAAFVSSFVLDRQFGLARGFGTYDDALDPPRGLADSLELERRGDRTVAAASAWLAARAGSAARPFFLWVHLYDAHDPYTPPASYRASLRGPSLRRRDRLPGRDGRRAAGTRRPRRRRGRRWSSWPPTTARAWANTARARTGCSSTTAPSACRSSCRGPGCSPPRVVDPAVRLVDVAPTLAALAGVAPLAGVDGRSARAADRRRAMRTPSPAAYAETYFPQFFMGWAPLRSVRDGSWKLIDAPEPELYDLAADPGERTNLYAAQPATARALRRQLETMARAVPTAPVRRR